MRPRFRTLFAAFALSAASCLTGQTASTSDLLNVREDINGIQQRLADLSIRVQTLETRQESASRQPRNNPNPNAVTAEQLQDAVSALTAQIAELREKLASAPKAPPAAVSSADAPPPPTKKGVSSFSTDFSKQGVVYVVKKGDTLDLIARKTGGKVQDIVNANTLADPSHIVVGRKLFIPGGSDHGLQQ